MNNAGNRLWNIMERTCYSCLSFFFRIAKKELTDKTFLAFMQFVKFGIVGVSNTVISYILYILSLMSFQALDTFGEVDYLAAQGVSFVLSVLWSFYWNNKKVFTINENQHRSVWKSLLKTYISYSFTGIFLNSILLVLWVGILHISEYVAPIINLLFSVPLNFIINKFWAFKEDHTDEK